jgi:hypothetical protein
MTSAVPDACDHKRLREVQKAKLVITLGQQKDNIGISYSDEDSPTTQEAARTNNGYHDTGMEPKPDLSGQ